MELHGKSVWVFGGGGHGKVVADIARAANMVVAGFIDDAPARQGTQHYGSTIQPFEHLLGLAERPLVALGVGDNATRARCLARLQVVGFEVVTLVHPSAVVSPSARIARGTVVMPGAVVNADADIGEGVIVNTGAVVEHDCVVGDYAHLSPRAALAGAARVGARTHVGMGACILPGVHVGSEVRVGAGAVVNKSLPDSCTAVGVPARVLPVRVRQAG